MTPRRSSEIVQKCLLKFSGCMSKALAGSHSGWALDDYTNLAKECYHKEMEKEFGRELVWAEVRGRRHCHYRPLRGLFQHHRQPTRLLRFLLQFNARFDEQLLAALEAQVPHRLTATAFSEHPGIIPITSDSRQLVRRLRSLAGNFALRHVPGEEFLEKSTTRVVIAAGFLILQSLRLLLSLSNCRSIAQRQGRSENL
ncbi:Uncharacterized protein PBTT_06363 [Plasmodiophora brassicae]